MPGNRISTLMSSVFDLLTPTSIGNIFLLWVVYMCGMLTLGCKDNVLEPGNRSSTLMSSALDLWTSKSIGNIFLPWVVHTCDMVILGGKSNVQEPGNHCVYRRTDLQPDSSITPPTHTHTHTLLWRGYKNLL
jgi:hypothetical protein